MSLQAKKYICFAIFFLLLVYGALWADSRKRFPVSYGVSFNQHHAETLGLNWRATYVALLDLHPTYVRIAAMWSDVEPTHETYNYTDVDWMMAEAEKHHVGVTLVVGQKAPRWPECYVPAWALKEHETVQGEHLFAYVRQTVERYKNSPVLDSWQVENEPFIPFKFGECSGFNRSLVKDEIGLVRSLDPRHQIIVTDSGELGLWAQPSWYGDVLGTTMYRVVQTPQGKTVTYDWMPPAVYKEKARFWGKDYMHFIVAELQTEPWFTNGNPLNTPIDVQMQTLDGARMKKNIEYARHVGASRVYLWGGEWWYFMKTVHGDNTFWDVAKETFGER